MVSYSRIQTLGYIERLLLISEEHTLAWRAKGEQYITHYCDASRGDNRTEDVDWQPDRHPGFKETPAKCED